MNALHLDALRILVKCIRELNWHARNAKLSYVVNL